MKRFSSWWVVMVAIVFPASLKAQDFVIGAEWLNYSNGYTNGVHDPYPLPTNQTWWNHVADLGLNRGTFMANSDDGELDDFLAAANQHAPDVKLVMDRLGDYDAGNCPKNYDHQNNPLVFYLGFASSGERRIWQAEYSEHYAGHPTGQGFYDAECDWDVDDAQYKQRICWYANPEDHQAGYMLFGLTQTKEGVPPSQGYWVKAKMRVEDPGALPPNTLIARIEVWYTDNTHDDIPVYAVDCPHYEFFETTPFQTARGDVADIRFWWEGNRECWVDFIAIDDDCANDLFTGNQQLDDALFGQSSTVRNFIDRPSLGRFKLADEPDTLRWPLIGYIQRRMSAVATAEGYPEKTGFAFHWEPVPYNQRHPKRFVHETGLPQYCPDRYPFSRNVDFRSQAAVQAALDQHISFNLLQAASDIRDLGTQTPIWLTLQAHADSVDCSPPAPPSQDDYRLPTVREIRAQVMIGLCYGIKGIWYFLYASAPSCPYYQHSLSGLVDAGGDPEPVDWYGDDRWDTVKAINARLSSLGPTLMTFEWRGAFSAHTMSGWPAFDFVNGTSITGIDAGSDPPQQAYVEAGWSQNPVDHLVVVNRRTGTQDLRDITVHLAGDSSCSVVNCESGCEYITAPTGRFTERYLPGDGHLFRVTDAVWSGQKSIACDVYVHEGATLKIAPGSVVTIDAGRSINIDGTVMCQGDAAIALNGGDLHFGPNGRLELGGSFSLQGSGALFHPTLVCEHGLNIEDGQRLDFHDGGSFLFRCDSIDQPQYLINSGTLVFHDSPEPYDFGACLDEIRNWSSGEFTTEGGATLTHLPSVIGWDDAQLTADGTENAVCTWSFRTGAMLENYAALVARHTSFVGSATAGLTEQWDGILVGGGFSVINAEHCTIRDIFVDSAYSGSGIHLYGSYSTDNRVVECDIERQNIGQNVAGDGVFLQLNSQLLLECSRIDERWFTGCTIVGGCAELLGNTIHSNGVGVSVSSMAQVVMQHNCIEEQIWDGLFEASGATVRFYHVKTCESGDNRIVDNGDRQVAIEDAFLYGGSVQSCGTIGDNNNVSHTSPSMPRVWMDGGLATMEENWWGVAPDLPNCEISPSLASVLFSIQNATFLYNPARCYATQLECNTGCDELLASSMQSPQMLAAFVLPQQAASLDRLIDYADAGNFSEVYRFIAASLPNTATAAAAGTRAALLASLETRHALTYPDSLPLIRVRLAAFLAARIQAATSGNTKAALTNVLARALYTLGDVQGSQDCIDTLLTAYPSNAYAIDVYPLMQLVAMSQRDAPAMDRAIAMMESAGYSSETLRIARTMKRAYHRYRAASPFPKTGRFDATDSAAVMQASIRVVTYPNPFTPSMVFEYTLPDAGDVALRIHAIDGREIATLVHGTRPKGVNTAVFHAPSGTPSGTYLYVFETSSGVVTGKIILAR